MFRRSKGIPPEAKAAELEARANKERAERDLAAAKTLAEKSRTLTDKIRKHNLANHFDLFVWERR